MRRLAEGMSMNFIQALAYRPGSRLLLMLGLLVVLSLAFTTLGPDQVLAREPMDGGPLPPPPPPQP
jgi:hypothetical protein